jgi:NADP-reducing hydrogenase subunit HndB
MKSLADLEKIRQQAIEKVNIRTERNATRVVVGMATCGIAAGARPILTTFLEEAQKRNVADVVITQTGCIGMCRLEPIVEVYCPGQEKVTYVKMTTDKVARIVAEHIVNGKIVSEYTIGQSEK